MNSKFNISLTGTYRPAFNESAFVYEIESTLTTRPLILFFVVDASHSMRFYIDDAKTVQRQSIVQAVAQIGVNNTGIIQNGDYISIATFSTDVNNLLEKTYIEVNENTRNTLDSIVTTVLKSDGGKTNYGKAFEYILNSFEKIKSDVPADSPHLTGPMLVWFLTDGRPWPEVEGNTEDDIFNYATKIGETGNELWIIGISTDASQEFLGRIALASQEGASTYQQALQDVPKEFLMEQMALKQTLWVDLDFKSQERLIHGLVNAIENARVNLGLIPEVEISFSQSGSNHLEFLSGINNLKREGNLTIVTLKRPTSLKIGQKQSIAFSLHTDSSILNETSLVSIKTKLYRGSELVSEETQDFNKKLSDILKEQSRIFKGAESVRLELSHVRSDLESYAEQLDDLINSLEMISDPEDDFSQISEYREKIESIKKLIEQKKGLAIKVEAKN